MTFRLIISTILFFTFSCKETVTADFKLPSTEDIDEIITVLIFHDTLPIFKKLNIPDTTKSSDGNIFIRYPFVIPICKDLRKITITKPDTSTIQRPLSFDIIGFESLFNIELNGKRVFSSNDSAFLLAQNDTLNNFQIPKKLQDTLLLTSIIEQNKKRQFSANFYDISIPIFSLDLKTAYVEIRNICSECGGATAFILQKINGHWKIKKEIGLWIS
jgi:hypothetical protein